ncbi:MAG: hypothetical protein RL088_2416 [Verrucomicrobiota bacterium]|jgi:hypothetical protein
MKVRVFQEPPPESLGAELARFEAQFRYPLGANASFCISHGRRYITFFEAIGAPTLVVAEHDGVVLGTIAAALRPLRFPDGSVHPVAYLGDLKVMPSARGGVVLARMFQELHTRVAQPAGGRAYAVVMDGTDRLPSSYTGRLDIPAFARAGGISVLKIAAEPGRENLREIGREQSEQFASVGFRPLGGRADSRSVIAPVVLENDDGSAGGLLEDTRLAKRLLLPDGGEMLAAHLSGFNWRHPCDGARFLRGVSARCSAMGVPAFFTAVAAGFASELLAELSGCDVVVAPATIFSCGIAGAAEVDWFVDTAEI